MKKSYVFSQAIQIVPCSVHIVITVHNGPLNQTWLTCLDNLVYNYGVINFSTNTHMLKSLIHCRPTILFDPTNQTHRELFHKFLNTSSWIHCPYQFVIEDDSSDVVHFISKKITSFYLSQEFSKAVAKKQQRKPSTNKVVPLKSRKNTTK